MPLGADTWRACRSTVISEGQGSRADKSLKHIIRAGTGKLKSSVPLTLILIFILLFHPFPPSVLFPPKHISLLSWGNWASNLRRRQEMTHHLTTISQARPLALERLIPMVAGKDNAYHLTIIQCRKTSGSCGGWKVLAVKSGGAWAVILESLSTTAASTQSGWNESLHCRTFYFKLRHT